MVMASNKLYDLMMNNGSFKIVDVASLGDGLLPVEKLGKFIGVIREQSPVLGEATYKKINGDSLAISRVDMANGIVTPGQDASGAKRVVPEADEAGIEVKTNSLVPKELIAKLRIDYDTLEDNLEQDAFENTLMELFGTAAKEDFERYFMFADTSITWGAQSTKAQKLLSINDGWIKTAGNKIYGLSGNGNTKDFDPDPEQDMWPIPLFKALYKAIPRKYIAGKINRSQYRLYVDSEVEEAYSEILAARPTVAGDNALLGKNVLTWKDIPVIDIASFEDDTYTDLIGKPGMLTKPKNMYWGTKRDVRVENEKDIDWRQLKNVLSTRVDCTYEDEDATAVALLNKAKPAS
nr:hypothetical protein [uncultured Methanobacterium sp.]